VAIEGSIEAGATLYAEGDVVVSQPKGLAETREKLMGRKKALQQEQLQALGKAQIQVDGTALTGVQISIGGATVNLDQNLDHPLFTKTPTGIRWSTEP